MSTTPSSASRIFSCNRAKRPSRTEGGTSSCDQLINPRRTALAQGHGKQSPWSPGQDFAATGCDAHGIAVHEIPDLRMIGVRMDDERHVGLEIQIDVLEHGGPPVYVEAQAVAAHASVFRGHVVAEAMAAKYFVLRPRDVSRVGSGANGRDTGFESLVVDGESPLLGGARFPENEGAADLRVVTLHARGQLGRHQIAGSEAPFRRRVHSAHLPAARTENLKVLRTAAGAEKSFDFRDERVFGPPDARRAAKNGVAFVGEGGGAAKRLDLCRRLPEHQAIEQGC